MSIYDTLNDRQREAVFKTKGPVLILAGAGSGKTRVLTHRISYLIEHEGVKPWNILAITFTNKAAGEMRERVDDLIGHGAEQIWVSTFHSTCVRILRRYIDHLGYSTNFTIYDTDDSKNIIKEVCKKLQDAFVRGVDYTTRRAALSRRFCNFERLFLHLLPPSGIFHKILSPLSVPFCSPGRNPPFPLTNSQPRV